MIQELLDFIQKVFSENIIAQGGIVIGGLTSLMYSARSVLFFLKTRFIRQFKYSVYFDETSEMYLAFSSWYEKRYESKFRDVEAKLVWKGEPTGENGVFSMLFTQYLDFNWIWYKGRVIFITKNRDKLENSNSFYNLFLNKYTIWGLFSKKVLKGLCEEVLKEFIENKKFKREIKIYYNFSGFEFSCKNIGRVKSMDKIFFEGKESLLADLDHFKKSKERYFNKGIRYKRGYFFYGPPGTGKTTIAMAMAAHTKRDIYLLNVGKDYTNELIVSFFNRVTPNSIVLLEDADRFLDQDGDFNVSTILNGLDGAYAPDDVIFIMTSNHREKIDGAILRSGRFDFKIEVKEPSNKVAEEFIQFHYDAEAVKLSEVNKLSMAEIQDIVMSNNKEGALEIINYKNKTK